MRIIDVDPDSPLHFDADPDTYQDPTPNKSDAIFEPPLHASIVSANGPPFVHFGPPQLVYFDFDADPAFDFDIRIRIRLYTLMIRLPKIMRIRIRVRHTG